MLLQRAVLSDPRKAGKDGGLLASFRDECALAQCRLLLLRQTDVNQVRNKRPPSQGCLVFTVMSSQLQGLIGSIIHTLIFAHAFENSITIRVWSPCSNISCWFVALCSSLHACRSNGFSD